MGSDSGSQRNQSSQFFRQADVVIVNGLMFSGESHVQGVQLRVEPKLNLNFMLLVVSFLNPGHVGQEDCLDSRIQNSGILPDIAGHGGRLNSELNLVQSRQFLNISGAVFLLLFNHSLKFIFKLPSFRRSFFGGSHLFSELLNLSGSFLTLSARSANFRPFLLFFRAVGLSKSKGVLIGESHVFRLQSPDILQGNEGEGNLTINADVQSLLVFQVEVPLLLNSRESMEGSHFPVVSFPFTSIQLQVNISSESIAFLNSQLANLLLQLLALGAGLQVFRGNLKSRRDLLDNNLLQGLILQLSDNSQAKLKLTLLSGRFLGAVDHLDLVVSARRFATKSNGSVGPAKESSVQRAIVVEGHHFKNRFHIIDFGFSLQFKLHAKTKSFSKMINFRLSFTRGPDELGVLMSSQRGQIRIGMGLVNSKRLDGVSNKVNFSGVGADLPVGSVLNLQFALLNLREID